MLIRMMQQLGLALIYQPTFTPTTTSTLTLALVATSIAADIVIIGSAG